MTLSLDDSTEGGRLMAYKGFDLTGKVSLVKQRQNAMRKQLGNPTRRERSMWEWTNGHRFIRLNWRGGQDWRVVSITLNDLDVMNRIASYVPPPKSKPRKP